MADEKKPQGDEATTAPAAGSGADTKPEGVGPVDKKPEIEQQPT